MKVLGIVAEYNPFHLGHAYHLNQAQKITQADGVVCIISSSFVQRGEPAIIDKWSRAEMAIAAGADLVLELPTFFSCRSAFWFAKGSVQSLAALGIITHLAFGAETAHLEKLDLIATILNEESPLFVNFLEENLKLGYSYPKAREITLKKIIKNNNLDIEDLNNPNNILAIAYLRILKSLNSTISPIIIKRKGSYHAQQPEKNIASATAIRKMILENNSQWHNYVPPTTKDILEDNFKQGKGPVSIDSIEQGILTSIRQGGLARLKTILEVREGIENRLWQAAQTTGSIKQLLTSLKTKRYTYTRLQRLLIHSYLNFTKDCNFSNPEYLRILGFNKKGARLLKIAQEKSSLPLITKFANGYNTVSKEGKKMLDFEVQATDLYVLAYQNPQMRIGRQDFYHSPVIIDN